MRELRRVPLLSMIALWALAGAALPVGAVARDNDNPTAPPAADADLFGDDAGAQAAAPGPVRMARFSVVDGDVTWRSDPDAPWSGADVNLPIRQGAQVSVAAHGRAEIQFDDGSVIRLGAGAVVTVQTLYSDADGEFTELKLTAGLASLRLKNSIDIYQVDTPFFAAKATGPARIRFGVADEEEVAVKQGDVKIEGPHGAITLHGGDFLGLPSANAAYDVAQVPGDNSWEEWNDARDRYLDGDTPTKRYAPANVALASPDLDDYGTWRNVEGSGEVWCPHVASDWRPYYVGHWVWCDPYGWTWVSSEPWGWAPYHYGAWFHCAYGWAWRPGPVHQYWCPAVVSFYDCNGSVCWVPLAPSEVYYPTTLACGFAHGNWSVFFSIGGCGVYYPGGPRQCFARPWVNGWVNRWDRRRDGFARPEFVAGSDRTARFAVNHNGSVAGSEFQPTNLRYAGASMATYAGFRGSGGIQAVGKSQVSQILAGRAVTAPATGIAPTAGPSQVAPTQQSTSPSRTFVSAPQQNTVATRQVFRSALSPSVARATGQPNAVTSTRVGNAPAFSDQVRTSTQASGPTGSRAAGAAVAGSQSGAPSGRQLSADEQAAVRARSSLGFTPRVRNEDTTATGGTGRGNTGTNTGSGTYGRQTGSSASGSQANRSSTATPPVRRTYSAGEGSRTHSSSSSHSSSSTGHSSSSTGHSSSGSGDKKSGH